MKRTCLAAIIISLICSVSFSQNPVLLDFPKSGTYYLIVIINADGTPTVKILPLLKIPTTVIPNPDVPQPVIPISEVGKIASDSQFTNLRPFFPQIAMVYETKQPEEIRTTIATILASQQTLKDNWAVLGSKIADYYDKLDPKPDMIEFMKSVAKGLREVK